ncbi:MAG: hypothetical protein HW421_746 [Ignavibacteria bacterium]|nr:hypothetical protein [Ignavibacteria bacterium]
MNNELPKFYSYLETRLTTELPGKSAQLKMAPLIDGVPYRKFQAEQNAKASAVLVLLNYIPEEDDYSVLLTLRSSDLLSHSGQISFPGGRSEPDESFEETAIREAEEEIGLRRGNINVIGKLSRLFIPPSNYLIEPVVAYFEREQEFSISSGEVEEILFTRLKAISEPQSIVRENWNLQGMTADVPLWRVHPTTPLWGATAMILMELVELYRECMSIQ